MAECAHRRFLPEIFRLDFNGFPRDERGSCIGRRIPADTEIPFQKIVRRIQSSFVVAEEIRDVRKGSIDRFSECLKVAPDQNYAGWSELDLRFLQPEILAPESVFPCEVRLPHVNAEAVERFSLFDDRKLGAGNHFDVMAQFHCAELSGGGCTRRQNDCRYRFPVTDKRNFFRGGYRDQQCEDQQNEYDMPLEHHESDSFHFI